MKKRILSILLALAVLVSLVPLTAYAGTGTVKEVATQQELVDALADASTDTVKLTSNIIINAVLTVERKVTLDLNGCVLGYTNASAPFEAMNITGDLTLVDSNPNAEHRFTCPYGAYGDTLLVYDEDNGERVVKGGIITNYGMHISGGKLTINGGSIVGSNCGVGAVEARNGSEFTMNDGAILGCYGGDIGGVYVADSTFTMNGGVIKENFAASISEGALFAYPNAVVNANGGEMHGLTVIDDNSMITKSKDAKGVTSFFGELRVLYKSAVRSGIFYGGITVGSESLGLSGITVTYKNGTDDYAKQVLQSGETAVRPVDPEKSDRAFKGWYTDEACKNEYDFTKGVTENITLYAGWTLPEQFSLEVGETYYFDLSSMKIPGNKNWLLPDSTLHYVPFTYAGTISAYQLSQAQIPTESNVFETVHSVFVSDYNVTYGVSWDELNKENLIFWGNIIKQQGVEYYIHAPTGGAGGRGPFNNEWQRIYDKNPDYLKNTAQRVSVSVGMLKIGSWCQDSSRTFTDEYVIRAEGNIVSARPSNTSDDNGYRPLLTFALAYNMSYPKDYAGTVTLKLNGGKLGTSGDDLKIAVKNIEVLYPTGEEITFNAPAAAGLTRPDGNTESYFMWLGDDGKLYAPGAEVPASVKTLTAKWSDHTHCVCGGKNEEEAHTHSSVDWQPWSATDSLPTSSGNYYLVNNVVLSKEQKLNADINLCFNGKTVSVKQYALSAGERMISVDSKTPVTVTLTDCSSGGLLDATDAVSFGITYLANAVSVCEDNKLVICGGVTVNGDVHLNDNAEARITDRASLKGDKAAFTTSDSTKLFIEGNSRVEHAQATDKTKVRISGEARVEGRLSVNNEAELVACDNVTINEISWQNLAGSPSISLEDKARVSGEFRIMAYEDDKTVHLTMNDRAQIRGDLLLVGKGKNIKLILSGDRIDIRGTMEFVNISSSCENITVEAENAVMVGTDINMPDVVLKGLFVCSGEIKDGVFDEKGTVTNNGKITGGIFYGTVFGTANIEDSAKRTVSFDTNGGSAVDPQKILRGQKAKVPTGSKKDGYVFDGWYKGTEKYNFNTPVLDDFTLTAQWTESAFTVRFDTAGGTDIADKTGVKWNDKVLDGVVSPTKEGYTFAGWKFQDTDVSFGTAYKDLANDDSVQSITLEAQWQVNKYTVTFDTDGGSFLAPITEDYGTELLEPNAPTKTGYTFDGWDKAFPNTMPAEDITLKAKWKVNKYTITFDTDGGSYIAPITADYGAKITAPNNPTKTGYNFSGWSAALPAYMPAENITLKAKWTVNGYTVFFDTDGGSYIAPITEDYGTALREPKAPTKTGYTFEGWDKAFPKTMPAENITLKAKWKINKYTITFDTDGGSNIDPITEDYGTALREPKAPTKTGYTFDGWYNTFPNTMPAENITLKAKWKINKYTITFDTDGGSFIAPITEDYGTALSEPAAPTKTGYTFMGWDNDFPQKMPAENVTLKAKWKINEYTVTFDSDGGTPVPSQTVKYGECAEKPDPAPEKFAYYVAAWVDENRNIYDFSTPVTGDITLKAAWMPNVYSIEFDANGGEGESSTMWAAYDHPINLFKNPFTKEGYAFKCWNTEPDGSGTSYKDEEEILNLTSENFAKIKLYAQWKDITPPDGKITVGSYEWDSFTDTLNPGVFFNGGVTVTITASDNSGTAEIGYILSPEDLSVEELKKTIFRVYEGSFEISGDGEYIVYVLLYDMNLNISYIRSERITVDSVAPVISGAENGGVYCGEVTLKVTDNNLDSLKIDGVSVTPEADGTFKVMPKDGEQTVEAVDKSGNTTQLKLTVFSEHDFEWERAAYEYWQTCKHCGYETHAKPIPEIKITAPKQICRGQDAEYTFEVEEGFKDPEAYFYFAFSEDNVSGTPEVIKDGNVYRCKVKSSLYPTDDNWLCVGVYLTNEEDGFRFLRTKVIKVLDEHTGGKATCKKQAVCDICGESYGDLDPDCHASLVKVSAKESTHLEEGCIEHWKCPDCGKVFADSEGIAEMAPEDVVIKKTPEHKVPENAKPEYDEKSHWYVCECGEKTGEEDHSFKWVIDKEPTADSTGLKHEECTVCKYKRSENTIIPKNSVPYTGDLIMLWAALFVISGGYLSIAAVGRKRKKAVR